MSNTVVVTETQVNVVSAAVQGPAGPPGSTGPAGAAGAAGVQGPVGPQGPVATAAPILMGNFFISAASNITISIIPYAEYSFTVQQLDNLVVSSGSIVLDIQVNGISVTGLAGLTVNTTPQTPVASGNNVINVGDEVTVVLSGGTIASNLKFTMKSTSN